MFSLTRRVLLVSVFLMSSSVLSACVGSGKSGIGAAQTAVQGTSGKLVVIRKGAITGAAASITIFHNGKKVGDLGNGQFVSVPAAPGSNKIEAKVTGFQGIGLNTPTDNFTKPVSGNVYYTVGIEALLVTAQLDMQKTNQAGFLSAMKKYEEHKKRNLE